MHIQAAYCTVVEGLSRKLMVTNGSMFRHQFQILYYSNILRVCGHSNYNTLPLSHVIFQCEPFIIQIFMMSIRLIIVASFPDSGGALGMMLDYLYGCSFTTSENSTLYCLVWWSKIIQKLQYKLLHWTSEHELWFKSRDSKQGPSYRCSLGWLQLISKLSL